MTADDSAKAPKSEDWVERNAHLWRQLNETPGPATNLLKLGILREIHRTVHAQKSGSLAKGRRDEARRLGEIETRVEALRQQAKLDGELAELIGRPPAGKKRTRVLPDSLFNFIEKEKLERYDRHWEAALAAEACAAGWRFWILDAWVQIPLIEHWSATLSEQLWPHGVLLFVESAGFLESRTDNPDDALWHGQWLAIVDPRYADPRDVTRGMDQWAGSTVAAPSPPHWKALYTPKRL